MQVQYSIKWRNYLTRKIYREASTLSNVNTTMRKTTSTSTSCEAVPRRCNCFQKPLKL